MRTTTVLLFIILPLFSFGQDIDSVSVGSNNYILRLGDGLVVGLPAGNNNQFLFISRDTAKAPAATGNFAEFKSDSRVIKSGSIEEIMKNPALQYHDKTVDASQLGSIWIRGEDPLTSKTFRIVRFDHYLDDDGKKVRFAIGETDAKEKFRIDLEKAIYSGELSSHKGKMFEFFLIRTGIFVEVE